MSGLPEPCPPGGERRLTDGEVELVRAVFGSAIATDRVTIKRRKWFIFHPNNVVMAPCGHLHFHPDGPHYAPDFCRASLSAQGLFIHEMVHVWQAQAKGRYYLPLLRHPFCRYDYKLRPGKPFSKYGIEQQAEIVRHAFLARCGAPAHGAQEAEKLEALLPFTP
ncbi:MAG: vgr related protein [Novosphingobium sp.]